MNVQYLREKMQNKITVEKEVCFFLFIFSNLKRQTATLFFDNDIFVGKNVVQNANRKFVRNKVLMFKIKY